MNWVRILTVIGLAWITLLPCLAKEADRESLRLQTIKNREVKLINKALYARDGRVGFLHDVDRNSNEELVALVRENSTVSLQIVRISDAQRLLDVQLGEGYPISVVALNLDSDPADEFIAAYGNRRDRMLKKTAAIMASAILAGAGTYALYPDYMVFVSVNPGSQGIDLTDLVAIDDDGSKLWTRRFKEGAEFKNLRFRMAIPLKDKSSSLVVLTNNVGPGVVGISGNTGQTVWTSTALTEGLNEDARKAAKWNVAALHYDGRLWPILFEGRRLAVLDPATGTPLINSEVDMPAASIPTLETFTVGEQNAFLLFGEARDQLQMMSLKDGSIIWKKSVEKVRKVLPLTDNRFMMVGKRSIEIMDASGAVESRSEIPTKVKTKFEPIYRDLNGDGVDEFVFVSGKSIVCWSPAEDRILWTESLRSFVGGVNSVALYNRFYDINHDGWLDVPAATGGGKGRWISGKSGVVLLEAGGATGPPIVGDWDGDGVHELLWWRKWYEIVPKTKKK